LHLYGSMKHVVIIGNGISGVTAARHIRKHSSNKVTIISSETNHFFSRTALMYIYMGHMKYENTKPYEDSFWKKNKLDLLRDHVQSVNTKAKTLTLLSGNSIQYDILIIASGSKSNKFGWPGQELTGVQSLYSFQDLERMEQTTRGIDRAVVVGGGLIGIEMTEMLLSRKIAVTMLVRESEFWSNVLPLQEANMISRHMRTHHVDLKLETELKEIQSDDKGCVQSIVTNCGETIPCQFVGLAVGVSPAMDFLKDSGIETKRGILVNEYLETNISDVYALGDCVERTYNLPDRKNIEQVWYTGRMMGEVLAQTICGKKTKYEPGPWFNSAKFFDIEFQTYGTVSNVLGKDESEFYWEDARAAKCMHLVWNTQTQQFLGINTFGIRLRHECFDRWLRDRQSIQFVINHLKEANFDPEFFDRYEDEIVKQFSETFPSLPINSKVSSAI
jgi:NAD(P)H-nitrite reductase large subunit